MLPVHIIGQGALGSVLISRAINAGIAVSSEVRHTNNTPNVVHDNGRVTTLPPAKSTSDAIAHGTLIIAPVKAYHVENVLCNLGKRISATTPVLLLHNGMGSKELVEKLLRTHPVFLATTTHAAKKQHNKVQVTGPGTTLFGPVTHAAQENKALIVTIHKVLDTLLAPVAFVSDMTQATWKKLAINAVINPLTALHDIPNGELSSAAFNKQIAQLIEQSVALMNQLGIDAAETDVAEDVYRVIQQTSANFSSMHQDFHAGRRTEIEAITGYIVAQGKRMGVNVSAHAQLLDEINRRSLGASYEETKSRPL